VAAVVEVVVGEEVGEAVAVRVIEAGQPRRPDGRVRDCMDR
jgi:hypothetical protein